MSHIFISYSHKDKAYVHKLQKALQDQGFDVWIDDRINHGTTWPIVIQKNLDACSAFIVIMTENAFESRWVHNEVTRAERKAKPFFALLLSGDTWLSFEAVQYENVTNGKMPSENFYRTLADVVIRREEPPPPPPPPPNRFTIFKKRLIVFFAALRSILSQITPHPKTIRLAGIILVILSAAGWGGIALVSSLQRSTAIDSRMFFSVLSQSDVSVYSYDVSSGSASPLDLGAGKNWDPTVSRIGNIYFTSNREDGKAEIYRLVNGVVERVTNTPENYQSWDPALSVNGTLYFTSNQEHGKAEIYRLVDARPVRVTDTPGEFQSWGPVISPNGTIYYTTNRNAGKAEIYRLVDGTPQRVTHTPEGFQSWGPAIGPNGTVYYTTDRDFGNAEIYRVFMGSSQRVTDTPFNFQSWGPAIGSDGTIYYTSNRENGKQEVYKLVDGEPERVSVMPGQVESFTDLVTGILPDF